ncbi:Substrate-specific component NikM [Desulfosporosinus sp. I2]|nr:Substrate-specific component NikM [Desulfosporosinus sp. I2]
MMFNVPIPDGTTAHAVGGSLLAILFGPWTAAIGVAIALVIQAIFFGDGGILAQVQTYSTWLLCYRS